MNNSKQKTDSNSIQKTSQVPLSVIIPVKNEAINIGACLKSVDWADQIFVVDSQSADETAYIAEQLGANVVQFHYNGGWPKKKNWAIKNLPIKNEWILIIDADERVTSALRQEITQAISDVKYNGYYMRWKLMFLGRWMKRCWSHGWMLRLFRKGKAEYEDLSMRSQGGWDNEVHENIVVKGKTYFLKGYLLHESQKDLSFWIKKQNEFSDWNAIRRFRQIREPFPKISYFWSHDPLERRKLLKHFFLLCPGKPLIIFIYLYFIKLGVLDGKEGLYFCALRAMHELNINAKMFEMQKKQINYYNK